MTNDLQARKNGTAAVFSRSSETYDRVGPRFFSHFGRRLVELAPIAAGAQVLDLATGRGAVLFPAAEKVGAAGRVLGIDLADGMVQLTQAEVKERGLPNVEVRQMDAEQLDLPDNSFDAVLCGFGITFFPELAQALSEVHRVLKPSGLLAATNWGASDERWKWIAEVGLRPKGQSHGQRLAHETTAEWVETAFKQAGFVNYSNRLEETEFSFADADEWWATEWSHGARGCLERMSPEALATAKTAAYERLDELKQSGGIRHLYRVYYNFAYK